MDVSYGNVPEGAVWAGIDTHADTNWLSVVDARGRELRSEQLPATADGCRQAAEIILAMGAPVSVGVECTGSYGAGIARELSARGIRCYEVVTPGRPGRGRGCSKDDAADALRAALQALSGRDLAVPKARNGWVEGVRALCVVRESLVRACTSYANLGIAIVREAPDPVRSAFAGLGAAGIMRRCASSGMPAGCSGVAGAVMLALCRLSEAWLQAKKSADELERRIAEMVRAGNPALSSMYGCGPIAAAGPCDRSRRQPGAHALGGSLRSALRRLAPQGIERKDQAAQAQPRRGQACEQGAARDRNPQDEDRPEDHRLCREEAQGRPLRQGDTPLPEALHSARSIPLPHASLRSGRGQCRPGAQV
jgi:transposase